jgi:hypothetical protein
MKEGSYKQLVPKIITLGLTQDGWLLNPNAYASILPLSITKYMWYIGGSAQSTASFLRFFQLAIISPSSGLLLVSH